MKRRAFITLFSSAAACPLAGGAQTPPKIPRVGYLGSYTPAAGGLEAFRHGLRDLGYVEGQTITLEVRWAEGRSERMPELTAELLRLKVDVLGRPCAGAVWRREDRRLFWPRETDLPRARHRLQRPA